MKKEADVWFPGALHKKQLPLHGFQLPLLEKKTPMQRFQKPLHEKNWPCIVLRATANGAHDQKVMRYDLLVMNPSSYPSLRTANY
jgi:hypothetical protein